MFIIGLWNLLDTVCMNDSNFLSYQQLDKSGRKHCHWLPFKSTNMLCVGNQLHKQAIATVWTSPDMLRRPTLKPPIWRMRKILYKVVQSLHLAVFLSAICLCRLWAEEAVVHCSLCFLMWGSIVQNHRKIMIPRYHVEMRASLKSWGGRQLSSLRHGGLDINQPNAFVSTSRDLQRQCT